MTRLSRLREYRRRPDANVNDVRQKLRDSVASRADDRQTSCHANRCFQSTKRHVIDRGRTDRVTALSRPHALDSDAAALAASRDSRPRHAARLAELARS